MTGAILYLPDPRGAELSRCRVAGRSLALRAVVAAQRAGATTVVVPAVLRQAGLEAELRRLPRVARVVRWIDATPAGDVTGAADQPCLLVPVSVLLAPDHLRVLLARAPDPAGAVLAGTTTHGAPVLMAPAPLVHKLWDRLAAGQPVGEEAALAAEGAAEVPARGPIAPVVVDGEATRAEAERDLYRALGTEADTALDRLLHRRCSLFVTRGLVRTPATPNQVSLASLTVGVAAVWSAWHAGAAGAVAAVGLYAAASVIDHCDGELARLTFQESRLGAHLDWAIDTVIHALLVLAITVTAAPGAGALFLAAGAVGIGLSATLARSLPREARGGARTGGVLRRLGNRDLFYVVLVAFALLSWRAPALLPGLAVLVAVGSHAYWAACLARILRAPARELAG